MASSMREAWDHAGRSRHERGYGTAWEKLRLVVLERDQRLCQPCLKQDRVSPAHAVDHIKPKAQGGTDDLDNLQSICRTCHQDKTLNDQGRQSRPKLHIAADGWPIDRG